MVLTQLLHWDFTPPRVAPSTESILDRAEEVRSESNLGKSRALRERALQSLAGGVSSPVRATAPMPLYYTSGKGARLFDVDNNEYIDYQLVKAR
jgi:glutamate-1-semialdehyde 2,1-aminomutase